MAHASNPTDEAAAKAAREKRRADIQRRLDEAADIMAETLIDMWKAKTRAELDDPARVDGATKRHDGAGDFPAWVAERRAAPRPTVFIKGNHEDFVWLDAQPSAEVLPGLHYLRNGRVHELVAGREVLRVGGIGGCYGPSNFERPSKTLQGYAKRHYARDEIATLSARDDLDIVFTHDAPAGVRFERHRRGEGFLSEAAGLDELLVKTQPRVCFFGHHHTRLDAEVAGVPCLGLNKGHYLGCLHRADQGRSLHLPEVRRARS